MPAAAPPEMLVVSRVVLDLIDRDGRETTVLGGSGFWAAFGAATVSDDVALASKVGTDFAAWSAAVERLGIRTDALVTQGPMTSTTRIEYRDGDHRIETPLPSWSAHVALRSLLVDVPTELRAAPAYYVFRGWHPGFWPPLLAHLAATDATFLWELPSDLCSPEHHPRLRDQLGSTPTIVSLNRDEARQLLAHDGPPAALVAGVLDLGASLVLLRCGADGAYAGDETTLVHATAARVDTVADVTGAGNASSGAFLASWYRHRDLRRAAVAASAAAGVAIEHLGPPKDRHEARRRAAELADTVTVTDLDPAQETST